MRRKEQDWRGSDVPFFGAPVAHRSAGNVGVFLPFADRGSRATRRVAAVLFGIGAVVAGVATTGILLFMALVLEFGSPPDGADLAVALTFGAPIAVGGVVLAVIAFLRAGRPTGLTVGSDRLTIVYPSFARPLVVSRAAVRAIALDEGPMRDRERFPVAGDVPEGAFVDALDVPARPFGDLETARGRRIDPTPGVIWERPETPSHGTGYAHDDPDRPGWGSGGSSPPHLPPRSGFLFNKHGHSLPFLRSDIADVPNVAVLFQDPLRLPRPALWFDVLPRSPRVAYYRGGRQTRGLLLHVADPVGAADALAPWEVIRQITSEDVTEQGLLLAKPLLGWRALVYTLLFVGPIVLNTIIRWLR